VSRWRQPLGGGLVATVLVTGVVALHRVCAWGALGLERLELLSADLRFAMRGPQPAGPETVIVAVDDRTYSEDPLLFERRAGWARMVRAAHRAGAKVIALDALFLEPERLLSDELQRDVESYVAQVPEPDGGAADGLLRRAHAELQGDTELEAALKEAGNVVLIMHLGLGSDRSEDRSLARGRYGQSSLGASPPREAARTMASFARINESVRSLGFATVIEDDTHTVRQMELALAQGPWVYAPLAVQTVARYLDVSRGRLAYLGSQGEVRIGDKVLPLPSDDKLWINYRGPRGLFPTYSASDLVRGRVPPEALAGRIVMIGMAHLGHDTTRTPFQAGVPGVELQATLVDNLLRGDPLRRVSWQWDVLASLLMGVRVSLLFWPRLVARQSLQVLFSLALFAGWLGATAWLFAHRGVWLTWIGPAAVFVAAAGASLSLSYLGEGLQRRRLRKAFAHYLGDDVIRELLARPDMLSLGGERRNLSVLFSEIRGFTTLSEQLTPEQLVNLLNTYLTPMTDAVLRQGGLLDKYIGDAVMAVFGAPVVRADHAERALRCAAQMHAELEALQPQFEKLGLKVAIGVGINTGDMVVGNMGSRERFDYTVAGDAVNLASRLEGLTKVYGAFCLVSEATRRAVGPEFSFREVDLVQVKGKREAIAIHELLAAPGRELARHRELAACEEGLAAYRAGRFEEARGAFGRFLAANPEDPVARLYLERMATLGEAPAGWTGVFAHTSK